MTDPLEKLMQQNAATLDSFIKDNNELDQRLLKGDSLAGFIHARGANSENDMEPKISPDAVAGKDGGASGGAATTESKV